MQTTTRRLLAFAIALAAASLLPAALYAQTPRIERVDILEAGIYCTETIGKTPQPNAPGGYVNIIAEARFLKRTTEVPMQLGTRFGMRYTIVGSPVGANANLRLVTRMPSPGLHDPATGKTMLVSDYSIAGRIGETGFRGTHLEFDWELLPGVWTFEFWSGDRKLAAQNFTLSTFATARHGNWRRASCAPLMSAIAAPTTPARN
jgi:hypothetical protein